MRGRERKSRGRNKGGRRNKELGGDGEVVEEKRGEGADERGREERRREEIGSLIF